MKLIGSIIGVLSFIAYMIFSSLQYFDSKPKEPTGTQPTNIYNAGSGGIIIINAPSPGNSKYQNAENEKINLEREQKNNENADRIKSLVAELQKIKIEMYTYIDIVKTSMNDSSERLKLSQQYMANGDFANASKVLVWGPDRTTYTISEPADHVVFNSIKDNPVQGDERNFVQIREINASNSTYSDSINLEAGHDYVVYMYYHNNAASNLNDNGVGVAKDAYARAEIPDVVPNGSNDTQIIGYIGSSNSKPNQVWDDVSFINTTGGDIALRYIPGSATIHSLGSINGGTMSDSIATTGAALGYNAFDGVIPGCNQYAGYVTFEIRADQPNFDIIQEVRIVGSTTWSKKITAKAGDMVEYRIQYINNGSTTQNDVVIRNIMSEKINYIIGSTNLKNSNYPSGKSVSDNIASKLGINIGNYDAGSNSYIKFNAKISKESLLSCGTNILTNTAFAQTNNGAKQDTAVVNVIKSCE